MQWNGRSLLKALVFLTGFFTAVSAFARPSVPVTGTMDPRYANFDKVMLSVMRVNGIPGAELAIIHDGQLVVNRGYGYADVAKGQPVEPTNLFRIASVSKMVTFATTLTLVQSGRLKLDQDAYVILQDLHPFPSMHLNPEIYNITIQELLNMSIAWNWHDFDALFGPWPKSYIRKIGVNPPWTCETVARVIMGEPIHDAGKKFHYSNIDACILGLVISKITTGQYSTAGYEQYVQQALLNPLGITDMRLGSSDPNLRSPDEVHYYADIGSLSQPNPDIINFNDLPYGYDGMLQNNAANGGWTATASDIAKLAYALATGKVLNPELEQDMFAPPPDHRNDVKAQIRKATFTYQNWPYGMGWFLLGSRAHPVWHTHGHFTGTNAFVVRDWNNNIFVVMFNKTSGSMHSVQMMRRALQRTFIATMDGKGTLVQMPEPAETHHGRYGRHHPASRNHAVKHAPVHHVVSSRRAAPAHSRAASPSSSNESILPPPTQTLQ